MILLLSCVAMLAGCSSPFAIIGGKGTLKVGVRADISGFGYYNDKAGKYSGMEIDLAEDLAKRMGYHDVEFVTVTPDNRKEKLQSGEVDALIACYSITSTREENFDFSPSYYDTDVQLMVQNSSMITSINNLKGGVIGTMSGADTAPILVQKLIDIGFTDGQKKSANDDNTDVTFDNFHLLQFDTYEKLSMALESGEVDAIALDGAVAKAYTDSDRSTLQNFSIEQQRYGVATQKGSDLSSKVSETVQAMLDDGTIAQLIDKWN